CKPAVLRKLAELGNFVSAIDEAIFGCVGDRNHRRLNLVDVVADQFAGFGNDPWRDLRAFPTEQDQFRAAGEEARRPRLVDFDMRVPMAEDRAVGRAQSPEGKAICSSSGGYPKS